MKAISDGRIDLSKEDDEISLHEDWVHIHVPLYTEFVLKLIKSLFLVFTINFYFGAIFKIGLTFQQEHYEI